MAPFRDGPQSAQAFLKAADKALATFPLDVDLRAERDAVAAQFGRR